jgi:hypothetical protein
MAHVVPGTLFSLNVQGPEHGLRNHSISIPSRYVAIDGNGSDDHWSALINMPHNVIPGVEHLHGAISLQANCCFGAAMDVYAC